MSPRYCSELNYVFDYEKIAIFSPHLEFHFTYSYNKNNDDFHIARMTNY